MGKQRTNKHITTYPDVYDYVTDIIGKAVAVLPPVSPYTIPTPIGGGFGQPSNSIPSSTNGIEPLRRLITLWESCGGDMSRYNTPSCYNAYKGSTGWVAAFGSDISNFTIQQVIDKGTAAVGKYQFIDSTLKSIANSLGLNLNTTKFTPAIQDRCGEKLIMNQVKDYVNGVNAGSQRDLENAVLRLSQTWAALPTALKVIDLAEYNRTNGRVKKPIANSENNVVAGTGNRTYWGGVSTNKKYSRFNITESVNALIQSRINITGTNPQFVPTYFNAAAAPPPMTPPPSLTPPTLTPPPPQGLPNSPLIP